MALISFFLTRVRFDCRFPRSGSTIDTRAFSLSYAHAHILTIVARVDRISANRCDSLVTIVTSRACPAPVRSPDTSRTLRYLFSSIRNNERKVVAVKRRRDARSNFVETKRSVYLRTVRRRGRAAVTVARRSTDRRVGVIANRSILVRSLSLSLCESTRI